MDRHAPTRAVRAVVVLALAATTTLAADARYAAAVPFNTALSLDGVDDYASVADSASIDLGDTEGEDFTLESFIYVPDLTGTTNQVVVYKHAAYTLSVVFSTTATNDKVQFRFWTSPTTSATLTSIGVEMTTGWHHVAAVFDNEFTGGTDRAGLYFDGAEVGNTSAFELTPGIPNSANPLSIGANSGAVPLKGGLDEVRLSESARYSGGYTVPASAFVGDGSTRALWHFDETACSTSFADASGNGNTATGQNGAQIGSPGAPAPTLRFSATPYLVSEAVGSATVTVTRDGDQVPAVGVSYATSDGTADADDYSSVGGPLNFPCGVVSRTFEVPVTNDSATEKQETINLSLSAPTGGASLGTPSNAKLRIKPSDQQPDGLISTDASANYAGDNVYNLNGIGQTRSQTAPVTQTRTFHVRAQNDGNVTNLIKLRSTAAPADTTVTYLDGATDVTASMLSANGYKVSVVAGAFRQITVNLTVLAGASAGSVKVTKVTASITSDGARSDVVKAKVTVT